MSDSPTFTVEFMGQVVTLPAPREMLLELDALDVSDVIAPSREFVECVRRFGVVTPIVAFEDRSPDTSKRLRVADGRRRIAAAKQLGLRSIPATVYAVDSFVPDVMTMVLNEQRRDNPVADFNAIQRLQQRGATEREISEVTGMPLGRIRRRTKLAALHPELFDGLGHGVMSVSTTEACASLPTALQAELLARLREVGKLTMPDVREIKVARKTQAVAGLVLEGLGSLLLGAATAPATLAEIAAVLSTYTLQQLRAELPAEPRFDALRQVVTHELAETWRVPLTGDVFTRSNVTTAAH
jgi:ParB/RepB/Spo0J family partition protein